MLKEIWDDLLGRTKSRGRRAQPNRLDKLQAAADVAGVADQSGTTDLINAGVSVVRGLMSKRSDERRAHFKDALIRGVSAIPVVGDLAKLARSGEYAKVAKSFSTRGRAASAAATSQKAAASAGTAAAATSAPAKGSGWKSMLANLGGAFLGGSAGGGGSGGGPAPAQQATQGLSASEKIAMMGKSAQEIEAADNAKRAHEEMALKEEEATAALGEMVDKLKSGTKGIGAMAIVLAAFPRLAKHFGDALVESRRDLAQYSGTLASAVAQLDITKFQLDIQTARSTAGSGSALTEEVRRLHQEIQPWRETFMRIENVVGIAAAKLAIGILDVANMAGELTGVKDLVKKLNKWLEGMGANGELPPGQRFLEMLAMQKGNPAGQRDPLPELK